jgi:mRNA interferase RelE/StbE
LAWKVEFTERAGKELRAIDAAARKRILRFLRERVATEDNPRRIGKALTSRYAGRWRYRVGDYRLICQIEDDRLLVLVFTVGHRREIYR